MGLARRELGFLPLGIFSPPYLLHSCSCPVSRTQVSGKHSIGHRLVNERHVSDTAKKYGEAGGSEGVASIMPTQRGEEALLLTNMQFWSHQR
jgi:hypothetical protein